MNNLITVKVQGRRMTLRQIAKAYGRSWQSIYDKWKRQGRPDSVGHRFFQKWETPRDPTVFVHVNGERMTFFRMEKEWGRGHMFYRGRWYRAGRPESMTKEQLTAPIVRSKGTNKGGNDEWRGLSDKPRGF